MPQSQTAALPRPQEEEETDISKQAQIEQTYRKALRLALSSLSEVIAILKGLKTQEQMTHGKTYNKSLRRNRSDQKSKMATMSAILKIYFELLQLTRNLKGSIGVT